MTVDSFRLKTWWMTLKLVYISSEIEGIIGYKYWIKIMMMVKMGN